MKITITMLAALALAGCGETRPLAETVAWDGHPMIVLCRDQATLRAHASEGFGFGETLHGWYSPREDTIYLLCADESGRLTIPQALHLAHELQHAADAHYGGKLWCVLHDESSPNGCANGGSDFDCHGYGRKR